MATLKIAKDLFDLLYPVGTYYETSNADWTPSSAGWYGTWVQDTKGQTTVSKSDSGTFSTLGTNVGGETHRHDFKVGFYRYFGAFVGDNFDNYSGAYSYSQNKYSKVASIDQTRRTIARNNTLGNGVVTYTEGVITSVGDTDVASSIQPSKVVIRWHRTA